MYYIYVGNASLSLFNFQFSVYILQKQLQLLNAVKTI